MSSNMRQYQARQCSQPNCGLRFPVAVGQTAGDRCPQCGAATVTRGPAYHSDEARTAEDAARGLQLEALLDNVRSLRNVGSMFRTADGAGVRTLHLGGFTPTPDHPKMAKTSLGAEQSVPWTYARDGAERARQLCDQGARLWAIEGGPRSSSLFDLSPEPAANPPVVLVFGHEVSGVDPRILEMCERVLRVPMLGMKGSLNVSVAFGIAVYHLRFLATAAATGSG